MACIQNDPPDFGGDVLLKFDVLVGETNAYSLERLVHTGIFYLQG
jgi:hypothetical protein